MDNSENNNYNLPITFHSAFKPKTHALFITLIIMLSAILFIPGNEAKLILCKVFFLLLNLYLIYNWLFTGVFKKATLTLNEKNIILKTAACTKRIAWEDVYSAETYMMNNNNLIGIVSKKKVREYKDNFFQGLIFIFGGNYSFSIPLTSFPDVDSEKLFATISNNINLKQKEFDIPKVGYYKNSSCDIEEEKEKSTTKSLIKSLLISLFVGLIYGLIVYMFNVNVVFIPFFGMIWIIYTYNKTVKKETNNFFARFALGLIISFQFLIGPWMALMIQNTDLIKLQGLIYTSFSCAAYMGDNWPDFLLNYIVAFVFFFFGLMNGVNPKILRKFKSLFIKKSNGYSIVKDKRYVSIYMIDYADYNENEEKMLACFNPNQLLIETTGKKINALYLPVELLLETGIIIYDLKKENVDGLEYYKIDLGGKSEIRKYGYECHIISDKSNRIELIEIEVD